MAIEGTINDRQMVLVTLAPDGPVDGVPAWSVKSGNGTLRSDPTHAGWDASLPEGYQMFLVSETLPNGETGPVTTVYEVSADVDMGTGVRTLTEAMTMHVINEASSLGVTAGFPVDKPVA